jgi:hypothetical protein
MTLSLVMPYYMNPRMLAIQFATWAEYPDELKGQLEIVLVDDGSPIEAAIDVPRPPGLPPLSLYRVLEDRPWHQHGARNLGAHVAVGDWLLLTDMDHLFPAESLAAWFARPRLPEVAYMFPRLDWPALTPTKGRDGRRKPHPNTFAMTREMYWRVGGYDEEFCGVYGTDGLFRDRLRRHAGVRLATDCDVIRYSREWIADASTRTLARKDARDPLAKKRIRERKKAEGRKHEIRTLAFPRARVL